MAEMHKLRKSEFRTLHNASSSSESSEVEFSGRVDMPFEFPAIFVDRLNNPYRPLPLIAEKVPLRSMSTIRQFDADVLKNMCRNFGVTWSTWSSYSKPNHVVAKWDSFGLQYFGYVASCVVYNCRPRYEDDRVIREMVEFVRRFADSQIYSAHCHSGDGKLSSWPSIVTSFVYPESNLPGICNEKPDNLKATIGKEKRKLAWLEEENRNLEIRIRRKTVKLKGRRKRRKQRMEEERQISPDLESVDGATSVSSRENGFAGWNVAKNLLCP